MEQGGSITDQVERPAGQDLIFAPAEVRLGHGGSLGALSDANSEVEVINDAAAPLSRDGQLVLGII